jgi:hypothetical protein
MAESWQGPREPVAFATWWRERYGEWPSWNQIDIETRCGYPNALNALHDARLKAAESFIVDHRQKQGRWPSPAQVAKAASAAEFLARHALTKMRRAAGPARHRNPQARLTR